MDKKYSLRFNNFQQLKKYIGTAIPKFFGWGGGGGWNIQNEYHYLTQTTFFLSDFIQLNQVQINTKW